MHNIMKTKRLPRIKILVLAVHAAIGGFAWALPQGATFVNGQVSIQQPVPGSQVIKASNGAIINWKQFSIGQGETTQFIQPNAASAVLNRVTGPGVSQLLGQLKANGNVFLINPSGIVVGGGARIDTNSFVASTLELSDKDFLSGKLRFFAGSTAGRIRNDGVITAAPGGRIALIAPDIENSGIIQAPDGQILLAAGRKLEIASLDLDGVTFEIQAPTDSVLNLGKLLAENGAVRAFAGKLRQSGEVRASRLARDADGSIVLAGSNDLVLTADSITSANGLSGGNITLQSAHGTARVSGAVSASGTAGTGGDVRILGERVALEGGARVDVSGSAGGGQILVGGDFQGRNPAIQNASRVHVAAGAELRADATDNGDGGRVIVWADGDTRYYGDLSARGGPQGGNGGFAEVSGKTNLEFAGPANLGAPAGASGTLLLDPLDLIVSATSGLLPVVADEFADFIGNVVTVAPATLAAVAGNVVLQAGRDIYIKDEIALTTAGAGISMTAGGDLFGTGTVGSIFNNAGIRTNAGAVTLRADSIFGIGGIASTGGAVDLLTHGELQYSGAVNSGGGNVTLASQTSYVNSSDVNAGSGTIQVTGQTGVFNGSFTTTGTANLVATTGSISSTNVTAAVVNLTAPGNIFSYVDVTGRVNATSTGSSVQIYGNGTNPLRLGTLSSSSSLFLNSSTGIEQAAGGLLTAPFVDIDTNQSTAPAGSQTAPLLIAAPSAQVPTGVYVYSMAAPVHLAFSGSPTLGSLQLDGTVAALGGSTVAASSTANLTSLSLAAGAGVLNVSASASAGLAGGFELNVTDGAINAASLAMTGVPVELTANGAVTVGTMAGDRLRIEANGAVAIGSVATTHDSSTDNQPGIRVNIQTCQDFVACIATNPITAATLDAGTTGDVTLRTLDNGNIVVSGSLTGRNVNVSAGSTYRTGTRPFFPFVTFTQSTTNTIDIASATASGSFTAANNGIGDLTVRSLAASGDVYISAGTTYRISTPGSPFYTDVRTTNNISVTNAEPVAALGDFQIDNSGTGNVTLTGAVDRTASGSVYLYAAAGDVTANNNLAALYYIDLSSDTGSVNVKNLSTTDYDITSRAGTTLTVGQVSSGQFSGVDLSAGGNLLFDSIAANGIDSSYGNIRLSSDFGSVTTTADNTTVDVMGTGNVSITASDATNGAIGNALSANPMDIKAGASNSVMLYAGANIGAPARPVNVDTSGTIEVTSTDGRFHVAATDGVTAKSLSTIRLSASAAGIGSGNDATFASADLSVIASSNPGVITIGDPGTGNLVRAAGTLNEFKFAATGTSGLAFGNVSFGTDGSNKLVLSATNGLAQSGLPANTITAGSVSLAGGGGGVSTGAISARTVGVSGDGLSLGSITTNGTSRSTSSGAIADALKLSSTDDIFVVGNLTSATAIDVNSTGGDVNVTGFVNGTGSTRFAFRAAPDQVQLRASGDITTGGAVTSLTTTSVVAGGLVNVGGAGVGGGITAPFGNNLNDSVTVTSGSASSIDAAAITGGFTKTVTGGTLNVAGIAGAVQSTTINGTTFNTGNISTGGALVINATAAYVPASAIALSATSSLSITAPGGIDLVTNAATLNSPNVTLRSLGGASGGDVKAALTGTTNLTVNTDHKFAITSGTALTNLNVTADGVAAGAGAGSSAGAPGQSISVSTASGAMAMGLQSGTVLTDRYTENSSLVTSIDITTTGAFGTGGSSINVSAPVANITAPSVTLSSGSLTLSTAGDITLTSVATAGGSVSATTSAGTVNLTSVASGGGSVTARTSGDATKHVNVDNVTSLGGSVSLTSDNGSIVRSLGATGLQVDTRNGVGAASGTTTLNASNGSVGTAAAPILTRGALTLSIRAKDEIEVDAGTAAALTNLSVTAAATGTGLVNVANSNYAGLSVTRVVDADGPNLTLGALTGAPGAFSLTASEGDIKVGGDISGVTTLALNAGNGFNTTGDLFIAAGTGPRSVSAGSYSMQAGRDVLITAGATALDNVSVTQTSAFVNNTVSAGRDIVLRADGGSAVLSQGVSTFTQTVSAGNDLRVTGGSAGVAGASAAITSAGSQSLTANNSLVIQGGSSDGATARITAVTSQNTGSITNLSVLGGGNNASAQLTAGTSQSMTPITGEIKVLGGGGTDAFAEIVAVSNQSLGSTSSATDLVQVKGGTDPGAYASVRTTGSQTILSSGDIRVEGGAGPTPGAGPGAYAELRAGTSQTIGNTDIPCCSFNDPTAAILVQAGLGGTAQILAGGSQVLRAGEGISVLGGSGVGLSASIETTVGTQNIGTSGTSGNNPTADILVQGGTATNAFASIKAPGTQTINTGGTISVLGGSGPSAGAVPGAYAEIVSSGGAQTIGSTSTSSNLPTGSIVVRAGTGGIAQIKAHLNQTIRTSGDLSVIGGDAADLTASIESVAGFQTIGDTSTSGRNPSDSIFVTAGTATGAAAWVKAATGQTIDAGGTIDLLGGPANAFAAITTAAGPQSIGNQFGSNPTNSISLTGGTAAGSYAKMSTAGSQTLRTAGNLSLTGGTGDNSGAMLLAGTGQTLGVSGNLAMLGGSGSAPGLNETAIRNDTSGGQFITVGGDLRITGGGFGSDTWIKQNDAPAQPTTATQQISVAGNLALLAPAATPGTGVTSIEALTGGQDIQVGGAISIDNQGGWQTYLTTTGTQDIAAQSLAVSLSSTNGTNPFAGLSAIGDMAINLSGDGSLRTDGTVAPSATLTLTNLSAAAGSLAAIKTSGNLSVLMDYADGRFTNYEAAGLVALGSTNGAGATTISAGGDLTVVAGELLLQGGATAASDARLLSGAQAPGAPSGTMLISTLSGPVNMFGGAGGGAYIDPMALDIVSNGSVLMQAGAAPSSNTNITAGTFNLAPTAGNLSLINSGTATSTITAGTFNLFGAGNVVLQGGTISVANPSAINIIGQCIGCDTNLLPASLFTISAAPPPPPTDFGAAVVGELLALAELSVAMFELVFDENGDQVLRPRRLNQCY